MVCKVPYYASGKVMVTENKSPSRVTSKVPPIIVVRFWAMESPSPLPSVVLDSSPLAKRSVSSAALPCSGCSEIFLIEKILLIYQKVYLVLFH